MHPSHFEAEIVRPTLARLSEFDERLYSQSAVTLMMGTAAVESDLGYFLRQHPTGPGRGFWQVEPATHQDVWRYLAREKNLKLANIILSFASDKTYHPHPAHSQLVECPLYCCAVARVRYWMVPESLPDDLDGIAGYWKQYFNTPAGAGTVEHFLDKYREHVDG